jgi:YidC/Oxa1 family membrane protein insertase
MDKQSTIGFVLIAAVLMAWMWYSSPKQNANKQELRSATEKVKDSVHASGASPAPMQAAVSRKEASTPHDTLGKYFAAAASGAEHFITIETDNYRAVLSTRGGVIRSWELRKYKTWDGRPVELVAAAAQGDFSLLFNTTDGKLINTRNLFFDTPVRSSQNIVLTGTDEYTASFVLKVGNGAIVKTLKFKNGDYTFDASVTLNGMQQIIANYEYQIIWESGLQYAEHNSVDESQSAKAFAYAGGELTEIDAAKEGEAPVSNTNGSTDWVAARTKYFAVAMISTDKKAQGAYLEGRHQLAPNGGAMEHYSVGLKVPYKNGTEETATFTVFLGPLDFTLIKSYGRGLDNILSMGWSWIRPLNNYIFMPLFGLIHLVVPNYGIVIIIFSILIKVALHPLNKNSMKSMKKMQALQPMMEELKAKYKDEPAKMNEQVMKLYKDYGVNPAGGCLPLLLQMPILYALYTLFTASINLRQANFFWWITDLSVPDVIVKLPFTVPLFGMTAISGLAFFMGITMFIQQKMTVTDPRQKSMVWMMPIMMWLLFNSFPSGLNLYYFVFNILSIGQQMIVNKQHGDQPLQKVTPKKKAGGIMNSLSKNMPKLPKNK